MDRFKLNYPSAPLNYLNNQQTNNIEQLILIQTSINVMGESVKALTEKYEQINKKLDNNQESLHNILNNHFSKFDNLQKSFEKQSDTVSKIFGAIDDLKKEVLKDELNEKVAKIELLNGCKGEENVLEDIENILKDSPPDCEVQIVVDLQQQQKTPLKRKPPNATVTTPNQNFTPKKNRPSLTSDLNVSAKNQEVNKTPDKVQNGFEDRKTVKAGNELKILNSVNKIDMPQDDLEKIETDSVICIHDEDTQEILSLDDDDDDDEDNEPKEEKKEARPSRNFEFEGSFCEPTPSVNDNKQTCSPKHQNATNSKCEKVKSVTSPQHRRSLSIEQENAKVVGSPKHQNATVEQPNVKPKSVTFSSSVEEERPSNKRQDAPTVTQERNKEVTQQDILNMLMKKEFSQQDLLKMLTNQNYDEKTKDVLKMLLTLGKNFASQEKNATASPIKSQSERKSIDVAVPSTSAAKIDNRRSSCFANPTSVTPNAMVFLPMPDPSDITPQTTTSAPISATTDKIQNNYTNYPQNNIMKDLAKERKRLKALGTTVFKNNHVNDNPAMVNEKPNEERKKPGRKPRDAFITLKEVDETYLPMKRIFDTKGTNPIGGYEAAIIDTLKHKTLKENTEELYPNSGVYIESSIIKYCRRKINCKTIVSHLMFAVFTENALKECTLLSSNSQAGGKYLHPAGVVAIMQFVLDLFAQKEDAMVKKPDRVKLVNVMNVIMREIKEGKRAYPVSNNNTSGMLPPDDFNGWLFKNSMMFNQS